MSPVLMAMNTKALAVLAPALMLLACGQTQVSQEEAPPAVSPDNLANGVGEGPPRLTPEAERGVEGARNVLLSFARAIEQRRYEEARALLSPADRRKWSEAEFAALFADLTEITVAVPDGTMEGAAGSSFYSAPVAITGRDPQGRPIRIEGNAVLRRVNDVDGATPAQLRWHFETLTLEWTH